MNSVFSRLHLCVTGSQAGAYSNMPITVGGTVVSLIGLKCTENVFYLALKLEQSDNSHL